MIIGEKLGWFKFNPTLWLVSPIALESLEFQGLYINVMGLYWIREGYLPKDQLLERYPEQREILEYMFDNKFLRLTEGGNVAIDFLDEEIDAAHARIEKSKNAAKKRWENKD